jgi:hypothetical protein
MDRRIFDPAIAAVISASGICHGAENISHEI